MKNTILAVAILTLGAASARADEPAIAHMVYFNLKDKSPAAKEKLVAACQKYLKGHDGVAYFSAGVIADDFARDVNDRDWDVAVHLVFNDKVAHDNYQTAERHKQFVKENNTNWAKVRVFDSAIAAEKK